RHPVLTLGGRYARPRPLIPVLVTGPAGSSLIDGTLDTSADDTVFRESLATKIGLDLANAPQGAGAGAGMDVCRCATPALASAWPPLEKSVCGLRGSAFPLPSSVTPCWGLPGSCSFSTPISVVPAKKLS